MEKISMRDRDHWRAWLICRKSGPNRQKHKIHVGVNELLQIEQNKSFGAGELHFNSFVNVKGTVDSFGRMFCGYPQFRVRRDPGGLPPSER